MFDHSREFSTQGWFRSSAAPLAIIDPGLRFRAVNRAYERATGYGAEQLIGRPVADAFPDNPAAPGLDALARATDSFEKVLRGVPKHNLGVQRYDVPDHDAPGRFVNRVWAVSNSAITDGRSTVAVLHRADDVTPVVPVAGEGLDAAAVAALEDVAVRLGCQFPALTPAEVLGALAHSHAVVLKTVGYADPERAESLARLRLEVRAGHPALPLPQSTDMRMAGSP